MKKILRKEGETSRGELAIIALMFPTDQMPQSFTTAAGENEVTFQARLLPETLDQNLIRWEFDDDPGDYIVSGTATVQLAAGTVGSFTAAMSAGEGSNGIRREPYGRALPLRFQVTATAAVPGKEVQPAVKTVRQDEIDKCRQEYIDYGVGLRAEIERSKFTVGLHEEYANPKKIMDCYAYIYPALEAQKVTNLRTAGHHVKVTSGYRSPRYNFLTPGIQSSTSSTHIFGEAVDINPIDAELNVQGWKALWEDNGRAGCPKTLERLLPPDATGRQKIGVMRLCNGTQTEHDGSNIPLGVFPGTTDYDRAVYGITHSIHLGNSSKLYENNHD